ncbi:hypothetical protein BJX65DRAFT_312034 [Aspergillus insuetus]
MKFSTHRALWLSAALSVCIHATALSNIPTEALLSLLTSRFTALDSAISAYACDADISPITSASNALIITIDRGMRDISAGPALTTAETQALSPQFQAVTTASQATILALCAKQPLITSSGTHTATICSSPGQLLAKSLRKEHAVWAKLFSLIASKAPEDQVAFIAGFANGILATTQNAIDAFAPASDDPSASCPTNDLAPPPPARLELRSYTSANSSSSGNTTTHNDHTPTQWTVPPALTGAAVPLVVTGIAAGLKILGTGMLAVAVAVAL